MGADFKLQESGDIYALGVVLWQLTEFRKPFHEETPMVKRDLQIIAPSLLHVLLLIIFYDRLHLKS